MEGDKTLRPLGGRGDFRDGQRRSVTGKNRGGGAKDIERAEKLTLGRKLLDDGLDDYIAILQVLQRGRTRQAAANLILLRFGDAAFFHQAGEIFLDAPQSFVNHFGPDLAHDGGEAASPAELSGSP